MDEALSRLLFDPTVGQLVLLAIGLVAIRAAVSLAQRALTRRIQDPAVRYRANKGMDIASYAIALFFVGMVFSDRLGGFTVAFGVAGAGIAFALQEVIVSVAGWLAVSFGGHFRPGDRIQLGGVTGDVIDVGILRTTMMECGEWVGGDQYNGRIVRVANSFVFKAPVYNYSSEFPFLWDEIVVPIKHGTDYRLARELMARVAEEVVGEYARDAEGVWHDVVRKLLIEKTPVKPVVLLQANERWVELTLRYIVDCKQRRAIKDRLFTRILEEIDTTQGRVRIAVATINVENQAPLELLVADEVRLRGIRT